MNILVCVVAAKARDIGRIWEEIAKSGSTLR